MNDFVETERKRLELIGKVETKVEEPKISEPVKETKKDKKKKKKIKHHKLYNHCSTH
jgi:hypothetical protein